MRAIREFADKIAATVVERVNRDLQHYDMLVLGNIEQVIEEALILHGRPGVGMSRAAADARLQMLQLVAEARLCSDAVVLGIDSLLRRSAVPAALAELTALKRMAKRSADAMMALQAALQSNIRDQSQPAVQQSSEQLDETTVKALEFYAAGENHRSLNGKPSPVARDKGRRARAALEAISGEAADEGEPGEGEE